MGGGGSQLRIIVTAAFVGNMLKSSTNKDFILPVALRVGCILWKKFERFNLKICVLAIIIGLGVSGVHVCRGLYADGSFHLYMVLVELKPSGDLSRLFADYLVQLPTFFTMRIGVRDLNILNLSYSFGLIVIPLGLWLLSLIISFKTPNFWLITLAFSASYLNSGFFSVGEYNLTYSATAFCFSIITSPRLDVMRLVAFLIVAGLLTRSYEAMAYLGPFLAFISVYRAREIRKNEGSAFHAGVLVIASTLFVVASGVSVSSIIFPIHPDSLAGASDLLSQIETKQIIYSLIIILMVALAFVPPPFMKYSAMAISFTASFLFLLNPSFWSVPSEHYKVRTISGILLFFIFTAGAFLSFVKKKAPWCRREEVGFEQGIIVFSFFLTLSLVFFIYTVGFYVWAKTFEFEALRISADTHIEDTRIPLDDKMPYLFGVKYNYFSWDWGSPTLSILLRGNDESLILNSSDYKGIDPLRSIKKYPKSLSNFYKTRRLYY